MYILAIILGLLACYLIYKGWRQQGRVHAITGWLGLVLTIPLWIAQYGIEFGVIFAIFLPAIYVWLNIIKEHKTQAIKTIEKSTTDWQWNAKVVSVNTGLIIYHLILLMLISTVITVSMVDLISVSKTNQMALTVMVLPLIWAGLSFWQLIAVKKWPAFLFSIVGALASTTYLFI